MEEIEKVVKKILFEVIEKEEIRIKFEKNRNIKLVEDLELDSIAIMKFISGIEEEFSLNIMECEDFLDLIDNYEKLLKWLYDKCGDGVL